MSISKVFHNVIDDIAGRFDKKIIELAEVINRDYMVSADEADGVAHLYIREFLSHRIIESARHARERKSNNNTGRFAHTHKPVEFMSAYQRAHEMRDQLIASGFSDVRVKFDEMENIGGSILHTVNLEMPIDMEHATNRKVIKRVLTKFKNGNHVNLSLTDIRTK